MKGVFVMKIHIENFCALNHIEFYINTGINVIAGRNGCGKSQLLMSLAHQYGNSTLNNEGFDNLAIKRVSIIPKPSKVLWRPAIRKIAENARGQKYANLSPLNYSSHNYGIGYGYTHNVDERFTRLHDTITNMYVAGNIKNGDSDSIKSWAILQSSFSNIFHKDIEGEYTSQGGRVGLKLNRGLSSFNTLSTGELEFLSLLCDLLTETDVDLFLIDEIDAHFHPDLQKRIISEINTVIADKSLLLTTHSPSLMLSVSPGNLFFLKKADEVKNGENQICCLADDYKLLESVSEMYGGFINDIRLANHYFKAANFEILKYADECLKDSCIFGEEKVKDNDPQTTNLRTILLSHNVKTILEIGVGKGRLLQAFNTIDEITLNQKNYIAIDINKDNLVELEKFVDDNKIKSKFNSFRIQEELEATVKFDLCILANVIHEVGPDNLVLFLNRIFQSANNNAIILILEALELAVGEKRFVVFDDDALKNVLDKNIQDRKITVASARPFSHNGTPLLEFIVTVVDTPEFISTEDVRKGLESVVSSNAKDICESFKTNNLKGRSLAFKSHNLANARAYLELLSK